MTPTRNEARLPIRGLHRESIPYGAYLACETNRRINLATARYEPTTGPLDEYRSYRDFAPLGVAKPVELLLRMVLKGDRAKVEAPYGVYMTLSYRLMDALKPTPAMVSSFLDCDLMVKPAGQVNLFERTVPGLCFC